MRSDCVTFYVVHLFIISASSENGSDRDCIQLTTSQGAATWLAILDILIFMGDNRPNKAKKRRVLSCQRCRLRKTRCDLEGRDKCTNCFIANVGCVSSTDDLRKKRPRADYVSAMEKRCRTLERLFNDLKQYSATGDMSSLLEEFDALGRPEYEGLQSWTESTVPQTPPTPMIRTDSVVYGPSSVYGDTPLGDNTVAITSFEQSLILALNSDPDILHCVRLFFTWQYPDHNVFIFREAFLQDFLHPPAHSTYCSIVLILSISALGARMLDDERIYGLSERYMATAKTMLFSRLSSPSITSLQSFLLLAFYEICNGSNSSGWMLSGSAMRMGFDIGFQLHPHVWFLKLARSLGPLEVNIRSRIYWGCYIADHFISLMLGRPSLLKMSDALIPESENLPEMEGIEDYTYEGYAKKHVDTWLDTKEDYQSHISHPMRNLISLINLSDQCIHLLFNNPLMSENCKEAPEGNTLLEERLLTLYDCNKQISNWREGLPEDLGWDRERLAHTASNPGLVCLRFYYYIVILCLNRPFIGLALPEDQLDCIKPLDVCLEAISDVQCAIQGFVSVHGARKLSVFMIYSSILLISIVFLSNTDPVMEENKRSQICFFMDTLRDASPTWKLAEKAYNLIAVRLKTLEDLQATEHSTSSEHPVSEAYYVRTENTINTRIPSQSGASHAMLGENGTGATVSTSRVEGQPSQDLMSEKPGPSMKKMPAPDVENKFFALSNEIEDATSSRPQANIAMTLESSIATEPVVAERITTEKTQSRDSRQSRRASISFHFDPIVSNPHQMRPECDGDIFIDDHTDFMGGPLVFLTTNLFGDEWELLLHE